MTMHRRAFSAVLTLVGLTLAPEVGTAQPSGGEHPRRDRLSVQYRHERDDHRGHQRRPNPNHDGRHVSPPQHRGFDHRPRHGGPAGIHSQPPSLHAAPPSHRPPPAFPVPEGHAYRERH